MLGERCVLELGELLCPRHTTASDELRARDGARKRRNRLEGFCLAARRGLRLAPVAIGCFRHRGELSLEVIAAPIVAAMHHSLLLSDRLETPLQLRDGVRQLLHLHQLSRAVNMHSDAASQGGGGRAVAHMSCTLTTQQSVHLCPKLLRVSRLESTSARAQHLASPVAQHCGYQPSLPCENAAPGQRLAQRSHLLEKLRRFRCPFHVHLMNVAKLVHHVGLLALQRLDEQPPLGLHLLVGEALPLRN